MQLQGYMPESVGGIEVVNVKQQGYDVFYYADADKNVAEIVKYFAEKPGESFLPSPARTTGQFAMSARFVSLVSDQSSKTEGQM